VLNVEFQNTFIRILSEDLIPEYKMKLSDSSKSKEDYGSIKL